MSARIQVMVPRADRVAAPPPRPTMGSSAVGAASFPDDDDPPVGLAVFVGGHLRCFPLALEALRSSDVPEVYVTVVTPGLTRNTAASEQGVSAEFAADIPTAEIVEFIEAAYTVVMNGPFEIAESATHPAFEDDEPGVSARARTNRLLFARARAADMYRQLAALCLRSGDVARAEQHLHAALLHLEQLKRPITRPARAAKRDA